MRKEDVFRNYEEIVKLCKGDVDIANDVVIELTSGDYDNIELSYDVIQEAIKMIRCKRSRHCCDCQYNTKRIQNTSYKKATLNDDKYSAYTNSNIELLNAEQIESIIFDAFVINKPIADIARKYGLDAVTVYGILYAVLV